MIEVYLLGLKVRTSNADIALCLKELSNVLKYGTAKTADLICVFKALNYLKRFKSHDTRILEVIKAVEEIIINDIKEGNVKVW